MNRTAVIAEELFHASNSGVDLTEVNPHTLTPAEAEDYVADYGSTKVLVHWHNKWLRRTPYVRQDYKQGTSDDWRVFAIIDGLAYDITYVGCGYYRVIGA